MLLWQDFREQLVTRLMGLHCGVGMVTIWSILHILVEWNCAQMTSSIFDVWCYLDKQSISIVTCTSLQYFVP